MVEILKRNPVAVPPVQISSRAGLSGRLPGHAAQTAALAGGSAVLENERTLAERLLPGLNPKKHGQAICGHWWVSRPAREVTACSASESQWHNPVGFKEVSHFLLKGNGGKWWMMTALIDRGVGRP